MYHRKILQAVKNYSLPHGRLSSVCTGQLFSLAGESLKNKTGILIYCFISKDSSQYKDISPSTEALGMTEHIKKAN